MKTKTIKSESREKELAHLMVKPFSESEKESIKAARKRSGFDRPSFYHDAVVEYANRVNGEINA